jgi:broad specificity phosphatase PhoE
MMKEVYFIRHGESLYNEWRTNSFYNCQCLCTCDPMIYDPDLSNKGRAQVEELRQAVSTVDGIASRVQLVVTSPLSRAVDTCLGAFFPPDSAAATRPYGDKPIVCSLHRERLHTSGDVGIPLDDLDVKYEGRLDLSDLRRSSPHPEHWWYEVEPKDGARSINRESAAKTQQRVEMFLKWLSLRPETCIAVVGHSAYIKSLTRMRRKLRNCEIVRFDIEERTETSSDVDIDAEKTGKSKEEAERKDTNARN